MTLTNVKGGRLCSKLPVWSKKNDNFGLAASGWVVHYIIGREEMVPLLGKHTRVKVPKAGDGDKYIWWCYCGEEPLHWGGEVTNTAAKRLAYMYVVVEGNKGGNAWWGEISGPSGYAFHPKGPYKMRVSFLHWTCLIGFGKIIQCDLLSACMITY